MQITILYKYLQGHEEPGHTLALSFAQFLQTRGEEVAVVAGEFGYMHPKPIDLSPWRRLVRRELVESVPVIRTYSGRYDHVGLFRRLVSFLLFSMSCLLGLLRGPRPDIVYASTPPLPPMLSAWVASRLRGAPFVLEVRDLWPASATELAPGRKAAALIVMAWLERFLYDRADRIVALTQGIRRDIVARGWPPEKVCAIGYGVSSERFFPNAASGRQVREREGWRDAELVVYLGAHGLANNLDVVLRAASRLRHRASLRFVLIGDGLEKSRLMQEAGNLGLDNILFHAPVPAREAPDYINAADLCVVTLRDVPVLAGAIPSKLIEYMACGKPVLVGARGEARGIVTDAAAGVAFDPDDDAALSRQVGTLLDDPARCAAMGRNGCAYVQEHFSLERNQAALHEVLRATVRGRAAVRSPVGDRCR